MASYPTQIPQDTTKPAPVTVPVLIDSQEAPTPILPPQDTTTPVLDTTVQPQIETPKVPKPVVKTDTIRASQAIADTIVKDTVSKMPTGKVMFFPITTPFPGPHHYLTQTVIHYDSSIFSSHLLKANEITPAKRSVFRQDWTLGIILFALLLVAVVRLVHYKKLKQFFNAVFTERMYFQLLREEHTILSPISILLNIVAALIFALFFFQIASVYFPGAITLGDFSLYLSIIFYLVIIFLAKLFLYRFTGAIFTVGKLVSDYLYTIVLFVNILSIALIPLVIGIEYFDLINPKVFIFTGLIFLLISFLYRNFRGFTIANSTGNISGVYLFFYLCALEILPLIVLFKFLMVVNR